jgi:hypothetical protein
MPQLWTIRAWKSATASFAEGYAAQSADCQATFDQRLRFLAQSPLGDWKFPYSKRLTGVCEGLVEIRFKAGNVQQRPLGFLSYRRILVTEGIRRQRLEFAV